jgi:hypothetical protein
MAETVRDAFEEWAHADHRRLEPNEYEADDRTPGNNHYYDADTTNQAYIGWCAAWNRRATDPAVAELVDVLKDARRIVEAADLWNAGKISGQAYYHSLENHLSDKAVVRFARALLAQARGQQEKDHG